MSPAQRALSIPEEDTAEEARNSATRNPSRNQQGVRCSLPLRIYASVAESPRSLPVASLLALTGVLLAVLAGFHPYVWQASASDLKTLYASALCFRQHTDPYSFNNLARIFRQNHVVLPASWYGHAPVYPPFTLAIIAPLTAMPMIPAIFTWITLGALALAWAVFRLTRFAAEEFALTFPWQVLLIGLFAASPLISFGLEMCNVSIVVGALSMLSVTSRQATTQSRIAAALALAVSLLLKPHLALWVVVALLIARSRADRALALRSLAFFAGSLLLITLWMTAFHQLVPNLEAYRTIVHLEVSGGSMSPNKHELVGVAAQITSLASLLGYKLHSWLLNALNLSVLLAAFVLLSRLSLSRRSTGPGTRLLRIAAWSVFGLIATYHRAHDGIFLLVLLPYVIARLRTNWHDAFAWAVILVSTAFSVGPTWETYHWLATFPGLYTIANFLLYRQASLAAFLLLLILLAQLLRPSYWTEGRP